MIIIYLRTSRVIGSQYVLVACSVSGTVLAISTFSAYFHSQDNLFLQWTLSSIYRLGNGSSGRIRNLLDVVATL